ncbi:MAG: hypothetical protein N3B16_07565 [Candidatus Aminicenantes bacterium]|nr:hypothetical protein [Candidatus Aminicenantes bacterium]
MENQIKERVLISFLGKGDYQQINYQLNGRTYESCLALLPIKEEFKPDKVYIIGTEESKWNLLTSFEYERVIIPSGRSNEEFWEILDILADRLQLNDKLVAFDITHCFRSIPIFVMIFIKFLKFTEKNTDILHIYYGILETKQIIDIRPLIDLLEWIEAVSLFCKHGDLDGLSELVEKADREIRHSSPGPQKLLLRDLKNNLKDLSAIAKMTYVPQFGEIARAISDLLSDTRLQDEAKIYLKPLFFLLPDLLNMINRFKARSEWEAQLKIARWYLEKNNPSQALLVLREAIITHQCITMNKDPYQNEIRRQIEQELGVAVLQKVKAPIYQLWDKVSQTRNKSAHALMRRKENIDPVKALNRVKALIEEAERIMSEEKQN